MHMIILQLIASLEKLMKNKSEIVYMEFGSRVYGTSVPESDSDFKGIIIPDGRSIVLQKALKSQNTTTGGDFRKNTKDDVDNEIFALHQFFKLLSEGQTGALDMIFTPAHKILRKSHIWDDIVANRQHILSKKMTAFAGYCKGQSAKYSLKGDHMEAYQIAMNFFGSVEQRLRLYDLDLDFLINQHPLIVMVEIPNKTNGNLEKYIQIGPKTKVPYTATAKTAFDIYSEQYAKYGARAKAAMDNNGVDWKALYHAVRICEEGIELCQTGKITFERPEKKLLLQIRKGELPYKQVSEIIDTGLIRLKDAEGNSILPDEPNYKWMEDFIFNYYLEAANASK